jgi:DNA-binding protein YbaB
MFDKVKDLYKLQKQAKEIKKKLKNIHIEAESNGVFVTMNGEQEVISVKLPENGTDLKTLEENLLKAFNKGVKKSQEIAATNMRDVMGDLGLGKLPGA